MTAAARATGGAGLAVGATLGSFTLTAPLWRLPVADSYRATGPDGPAVILVLHAAAAASRPVVDAVGSLAAHLSRLPEHKHLARTLGAGQIGEHLFVVCADVEGSTLRDVLARKQQTAAGGVGARGAANLVSAAALAIAASGMPHGTLTSSSLVIARNGSVKLVDAALGSATAIAMAARLVPSSSNIAPEILAGGAPSDAADVYGLGALLYEALVGRPLERGGPRPSEVVPGLTAQVDEIVARACHRDPDRRFGSAAVLRELVVDALAAGGATDEAAPISVVAQIPSASMTAVAGASGRMAAATPVEASTSAATSGVRPALGVGGARVAAAERALAGPMADPTENWLVARGKFDYGPYSLASIVEQIKRGEIVAGNIIIDKDTGARVDAGTHPLLAPLVDAARQARDDARRAQAEVAHQGKEKRRGVALFGVIGLGVVAVGAGVWLVVSKTRSAERTSVAGVEGVEGASLDVKIGVPKPPEPKKASSGGGGGRSSGGGGGGGSFDDDDEVLSLDMSQPGLGSEQLSMTALYNVYSKKAGALASCVSRNGGGSAHIGFIVDGPTGKVTSVKVNGSKTGGLASCIGGVMRSLSFPTVDGPRTRAEFDIGG